MTATIVSLATPARADTTPTPTPTGTVTTTTPPPSATPSVTTTATPPAPPRTSTTTSRPPSVGATTSTTTTTSPGPAQGSDAALTPDQVRSQLAAAEALIAQLAAANSTLAATLAKMQSMAKESNTLLEQMATAQDSLATATGKAEVNEALSEQLQKRLAEAKQNLRDWAFYAYTEGGSIAEYTGVLEAMANDPSRAGNPIGDWAYLSQERAESVLSIDDLTTEQAKATAEAQVARAAAAKATTDIKAAKAKLDTALTQQKAELQGLRGQQAATYSQAGPIIGVLIGVQTPEAKQAYEALRAEMQRGGEFAQVGEVCSKDENIYPNGQLPVSALCPLWQAPGEMLRARAAAAFNAMSQQYAKDTGAPLCVTDSYRSLGEQVVVKSSRGMWAATPGLSPHGLGVAVDLCGGVNQFGTPAYIWMQQNAPLFGWYHPAWAEPNGSLPEPWHWQYAG